MPSSRLFVACGLITLALVGSVGVPSLAWTALLADAVLLAAFLVDRTRAARTPLRAERTWPPLLVQGAPSTVTLRLEAPGPRAVTLIAREALHPALVEAPLRRQLELAAAGVAEWRYVVACRRRGAHTIPPPTVRLLGPWGL